MLACAWFTPAAAWGQQIRKTFIFVNRLLALTLNNSGKTPCYLSLGTLFYARPNPKAEIARHLVTKKMQKIRLLVSESALILRPAMQIESIHHPPAPAVRGCTAPLQSRNRGRAQDVFHLHRFQH